MRSQTVALLASALAMSGCSGLRSKVPVDQVYLLQPQLPAAAASDAVAGSLRVLLPAVAPGLDTERIALTRPDGRLDYYSASRWPADLSLVLQPLLVDALRAGGRFRNVQSDGTPFNAEYLLQVEVRQFGIEYDAASNPVARVTLACLMGRANDRTAVRSFAIEQSVPAAANRMGAVVGALNQALGAALAQLADESARAAAN
jgi:ABC-type uncharacterized transport system auxiliary subunit